MLFHTIRKLLGCVVRDPELVDILGKKFLRRTIDDGTNDLMNPSYQRGIIARKPSSDSS